MGNLEAYIAGRIAKKAVEKVAETTHIAAKTTVKGVTVLRNLGRTEQDIIRKNQARHLLIIERSDELLRRGTVYDGSRNKKYRIRTDDVTSGKPTIRLLDMAKNEVGHIVAERNLITCNVKYELYQGGEYVGKIRQKNALNTKLLVDCYGWRLDGTILGDHYQVNDSNGNTLIQIHRAVSERHTNDYIIEYDNPYNEIPGLLLILTVELSKHIFD